VQELKDEKERKYVMLKINTTVTRIKK